MHLEEFRRKLSITHLLKICRTFSLVSFKMCRKFSVENIGVENFPLKMEKWPVENFLSKIVMFAIWTPKALIISSSSPLYFIQKELATSLCISHWGYQAEISLAFPPSFKYYEVKIARQKCVKKNGFFNGNYALRLLQAKQP